MGVRREREWGGGGDCKSEGGWEPRVCTLFQKQIPRTFSRTQIDFSRALKFTLIPPLPRSQCLFSLLPSIHFIFLVEFNRFPELSRTSGLLQDFPVLENAIIKFQDCTSPESVRPYVA